MKPLALIGSGGHGVYHLEEIRKAEATQRAKLVAVADPYLEQRPEVRDTLLASGVRLYSHHERMLEFEKDLECLVICSPVCLHETMLLRALRFPRIRRILLEKPPLPTLRQMRAAISADLSQRTRVGFQMILFSEVQFLKRALLSGRYGSLRSITISGGWPRGTSYYQRANWAGRMELDGEPVFDGPATNAMSHLLHNALYLADQTGPGFGSPEQIQGEFYRARPIESYDFAWLSARVRLVQLQAAVAHCLERNVPWRMRVETESALWIWDELAGLQGVDVPPMSPRETQTQPLYDAFLASDEDFSRMPNTLGHTLSYTQWTCGALTASGGIRNIPPEAVRFENDLFIAEGLADYLENFQHNPQSPSEALQWVKHPEIPAEEGQSKQLTREDYFTLNEAPAGNSHPEHRVEFVDRELVS